MALRRIGLTALIFCALVTACSSEQKDEVLDSAIQESVQLPAQELTAVGMELEEAKQAITGLGFTWVVASEDGTTFPVGFEVPGRFNLHVLGGIVYRQLVDGVQPYINVNAMSIEEAEDVIFHNGWTYRITVIDGNPVIDDDSKIAGRYNLWITSLSEVVNHEIDTVRLDEIWEPEPAG